MFRRLLSALISLKPLRGLRMVLVLNPSKAAKTTGVRHRLILGGKVIDLIRETESLTKEQKS